MTSRQPCSFDGCTKHVYATRLCRPHYIQQMKGKPLKPLRNYRKRPAAPEGYSYCNRCEQYKKNDDFYFLETGTTRSTCKTCYNKTQKEAA